MTGKQKSSELQSLLQDLYGDSKEAHAFYDSIPKDKLVTNKTKSELLEFERNICRYCLKEKMFAECRHSVKRIVSSCNGAFGESVIREMKKTELTNLEKAKLVEILAWVATKEV